MNDSCNVFLADLFRYGTPGMNCPTSVYSYNGFHIERPKAPFPGQMFGGQKCPSEFQKHLENILGAYIGNISTESLISELHDLIYPDYPHEHEHPKTKRLEVILKSHLNIGTEVNEIKIAGVISEIISNSYARPVAFSLMFNGNHLKSSKTWTNGNIPIMTS